MHKIKQPFKTTKQVKKPVKRKYSECCHIWKIKYPELKNRQTSKQSIRSKVENTRTQYRHYHSNSSSWLIRWWNFHGGQHLHLQHSGFFSFKTAQRFLQFEWPEEVVGFFEVRTSCQAFMNKIFNTDDAEFPKSLS